MCRVARLAPMESIPLTVGLPPEQRQRLREAVAATVVDSLSPRGETEKILWEVLAEARAVLREADIHCAIARSGEGDCSVCGLVVDIGSSFRPLAMMVVSAVKGCTADEIAKHVCDAIRAELPEVGPLAMLASDRADR